MSKIPKYWNTAKKYLSKKDKVMSSLIKKYNSPSEIILTSRKDIFYSLCKSIIGQQISVAAANSIFLKFQKKCENKINATTVSKLSTTQIKSCGLTKQKVKGIKSLAKQTLDKSFNPRLITKMSDEEATTNNAPINVFIEGISSQIKYPKIIPKTNAKYFNGDTRETSDNLKD